MSDLSSDEDIARRANEIIAEARIGCRKRADELQPEHIYLEGASRMRLRQGAGSK